jgi:hypothetical protein
MTLAHFSAARALQLFGALMTLVAVVLMAVSPYCGGSLLAQVGGIALLFDVGALVMQRGSGGAIPLSLLKLFAVGTTVMLLVSCAPPPFGTSPLIPQGIAQSILLLSPLPSILGAVMLRSSR